MTVIATPASTPPSPAGVSSKGLIIFQGGLAIALIAGAAWLGLAWYWPAALIALSLWLPLLLARAAVEPAPPQGGLDIAALTRDLSFITSHNALSAAGIAYAVKHLAQRVQSQLGTAGSIVDNAEAMVSTERSTATLSQNALNAAVQARESSEAGSAVLAEALIRMHQLSVRASASRDAIETLNQRSEEIQRVTQVIQTIASQTNLLALNAAIEAARAGEHGRGFAVVADEVRGLAGRTATATEEVGRMTTDIQLRTAQAVEQIQHLAADLQSGVSQVELTGEHLQSIARLAVGVESQLGHIAAGAQSNQQQLDSLFISVAEMQGDLSISDQQTQHLAHSAAELESQSETISERLAEIGLDDYHQRIYALAVEAAGQIAARFEEDIDQRRISLEDLFDRTYQPLPNTSPVKYQTRFDRYTDQVLPAIQEPLLSRHEGLVFAIACTPQGYVPTHNQAFNQPLTGDPAVDVVRNRTKRKFDDRTGIRCGSHRQPLLLQTYTRDTGELMHDLSVPIMVKNRHWGGLRLGYRPQ